MCQRRRGRKRARHVDYKRRGRRSCGDWPSLSLSSNFSVRLVGSCCRFISDVGSVSAFLFDDGIESGVVVRGVLDGARRTVGFQEAVKAFYVTVAVAGLGLTLDVVSARVVYAVHKAVRRRFVDGCNWNVSLCRCHVVSGICRNDVL